MGIDQPAWELQPDGSRTRMSNGIRITVRGTQSRAHIEHLVAWQEGGDTHILGLDHACRPVYMTAFSRR